MFSNFITRCWSLLFGPKAKAVEKSSLGRTTPEPLNPYTRAKFEIALQWLKDGYSVMVCSPHDPSLHGRYLTHVFRPERWSYDRSIYGNDFGMAYCKIAESLSLISVREGDHPQFQLIPIGRKKRSPEKYRKFLETVRELKPCSSGYLNDPIYIPDPDEPGTHIPVKVNTQTTANAFEFVVPTYIDLSRKTPKNGTRIWYYGIHSVPRTTKQLRKHVELIR